MTWVTILNNYLKKNGYDGLKNNIGCYCKTGHLFDCAIDSHTFDCCHAAKFKSDYYSYSKEFMATPK
jgi:hypothetical protein